MALVQRLEPHAVNVETRIQIPDVTPLGQEEFAGSLARDKKRSETSFKTRGNSTGLKGYWVHDEERLKRAKKVYKRILPNDKAGGCNPSYTGLIPVIRSKYCEVAQW